MAIELENIVANSMIVKARAGKYWIKGVCNISDVLVTNLVKWLTHLCHYGHGKRFTFFRKHVNRSCLDSRININRSCLDSRMTFKSIVLCGTANS